MCNMAYTSKGLQIGVGQVNKNNLIKMLRIFLNSAQWETYLSSKSIGCNSGEILKCLQLAGGKPFTNYFHIFFLLPKKKKRNGPS